MSSNVDILEEIKKMYGKKDFERILKLKDTRVSEDEKKYLSKMIIGNRIAIYRRKIKDEVNLLNDLYFKLRQILRSIKKEEAKPSKKDKFRIKQLKKLEDKARKAVKTIKGILAERGEMMIPLIEEYNRIATDHDFAQIANLNIKKVKKLREEYDKEGNVENEFGFFLSLIFIHRAEDRGKEDFIWDKRETPLAECINQKYIKTIKEDRELSKKMIDGLLDIMPELRGSMFTARKDKNGKMKNIEKYYPPLKSIK